MKEDAARLSSLVKKIRWKYDTSVLEVGNVKMQADVPLCEVFIAGPFPGICRIFYARGATLQVPIYLGQIMYLYFERTASPLPLNVNVQM